MSQIKRGDGCWYELDSGIRETVLFVQSLDLETTDSGDGVSKTGTDQEPDMLPYPHVVITSSRETLFAEADKLANALVEMGFRLGYKNDDIRKFTEVDDENDADGVVIEASYSLPGESCMIMLIGLNDDLLMKTLISKRYIERLKQ